VRQTPAEFFPQNPEKLRWLQANEMSRIRRSLHLYPIFWQHITPGIPSTTITSGLELAGKIVTVSLSANTKALDASEWGQIGTNCRVGTPGVTTGPPALNE
jgi:hypothetical protein